MNNSRQKFHVIIPARYNSSRLPGKPLRLIAGKTMIERVYECAQLSKAQSVVVATDDPRIADEVTRFGGSCVMTKDNHPSGTDRLQEAAQLLNLNGDDIIVNVQGDEPMIPAEVINQVAANLFDNKQADASTLCEVISEAHSVFDPNVVKVVSDTKNMALYFSRAPIPWDRDSYTSSDCSAGIVGAENSKPSCAVMRHIGIYGYRVSLLNKFVTWPMAALEKIEKLEQLRILAHGHGIYVEQACLDVPGGVDTEEDLQRVISLVNTQIDK